MASVSVFGEGHSTFDVSFEALDFQLLEPHLRQVIAIELPEIVHLTDTKLMKSLLERAQLCFL